MSRDWKIPRNSGGFFFDRYNFYRVQADRYDWIQPAHSCAYYEKTSSGSLDIGSRLSEYHSIPVSDSGSPVRAIQFLENLRPTADTCRDSASISSSRTDFLISSDENNMMFYYPATN